MGNKATKWTDKNYALNRVDNYIKSNNNTLIGTGKCSRWSNILTMCRKYGYDVQELCTELGYDYWKLKGRNKPLNYYNVSA